MSLGNAPFGNHLPPLGQENAPPGIIPRGLADDLMIFCTGVRSALNAALALLLAREYSLDIRGLVGTEGAWAPATGLMGRGLLRTLRIAS